MSYLEIIDSLFDLTDIEIEVFKGALSGDGYIGGRVAPSSSHALHPVTPDRKIELEKLAVAFKKAEISIKVLDCLDR